MATREELYGALRNADAAGDTAAAQKLAAYIQSMPAETPAPAGNAPAAESVNSDGTMVISMSHSAPRTPPPEGAGANAPSSTQDGWATQAGRALMDVPRQVGLTARYGLEGLGQASQLVTEPIRQMVVNPAARMMGLPEAAASGDTMGRFADTLGLPAPQTAEERVVGDATRLMAGGAGMAGAARGISLLGEAGLGAIPKQLVERGASTLTAAGQRAVGSTLGRSATGDAVARGLSNAVGAQVAGAAGAGLAGGAVREAGGGALAQFGAGLLGGLAGPFGASLVTDGVNSARNAIGRMIPQSQAPVDLQIQNALAQAGMDWSTIAPRIQQSVRQEVTSALKAGDEIRPDALARLVDFKTVEGAVPTRGMVTLDPVQITRERNLAKTGANSSDSGLQGLARVENENNSALIRALNRAGAGDAPDAYVTGERVMGSLQRGLDAEKANISSLYDQARDSAGRSMPLSNSFFANRANELLSDNLRNAFVPGEIRQTINAIARNKMPFTVDVAEQLKTVLATAQRAAKAKGDGNASSAVGYVRQALDETPVVGLGNQAFTGGARAVNPGNLPAIPGQAGASIGEEAIAAFNQARSANRAMMKRIEDSPALTALFEGNVTPDQFVQKFIVGPSASVKDVRAISNAIKGDAEVTQAVQGNIAAWLKDKALSGRSDEVGAFSPANYNRALRTVGDRKLAAFFEPEQIAQLKAVGRVGDYMKVQPVGSAVNNSNSGALLMGRGLDLLDRLSAKVPLLGIGPQVQSIVRGSQQSSAQNIGPSLLQAQIRPQQGGLLNLAPATMYGGLLSLPGVPGGNDERRY